MCVEASEQGEPLLVLLYCLDDVLHVRGVEEKRATLGVGGHLNSCTVARELRVIHRVVDFALFACGAQDLVVSRKVR